MQQNISSIFAETIKFKQTIVETNTDHVQVEEKIENVFKLRAPVVYTVEDLIMSVTLLLIISLAMVMWYGFARCIIYLAYHKTAKTTKYFTDVEKEISSTWPSFPSKHIFVGNDILNIDSVKYIFEKDIV